MQDVPGHTVIVSGVEGLSASVTYRTAMYNAGWSHNIKIDNRSFERVEGFKYLEQP